MTGLNDHVDLMITSGESGHARPGPKIFHVALRAPNSDPADAWHVGDGLTSDVAGARNADLAAAVLLDRTDADLQALVARPAPAHRIGSLLDLLTVLP